ncbi:MAG: hypothetical protein Q9204_006338, partial [Flavoplaca sp. TL-2023a]
IVDWDLEGRVLITELSDHDIVVFNIYAVNGTTNPYRDPHTGKTIGDRHMRKRAFHLELRDECSRYERQGWDIVIAGDLNISQTPLDSYPQLRLGKEHVLKRQHFKNTFMMGKEEGGLGMRDSFRELHGAQKKYSYRPPGRVWGEGMDRVDLILVSEGVKVNGADILDSELERGKSDHVPLWVEVKKKKEAKEEEGMGAANPITSTLMTPLPSSSRLPGPDLHSSIPTTSKPMVLTGSTHTAEPLHSFVGTLCPIGVSEPDAETVPRSSVPFTPSKGSTITLTLPRLPTPPPVTQCCPWNKPCRHSILTLENEPITPRFVPIPAADTRFVEALLRHAKSLLPPPATRLNPLGVIGDPPSLVLDNGSGSDGDGSGSAPETPSASNRGNDTNLPLPPYHSHPGHSHAHPSPTFHAINKAVPATATSTPNNLGNDDLALRIRETRLQRKYVRHLEEARRRHVTWAYRATMTYYHMAQCELVVWRAREEEECRRIAWLKAQSRRARTMAERTELQQELEMLLQMRKGR